MISVVSTSRADTLALGGLVADVLIPGDTVVLTGELGGGKTAFVTGAVQGLGSEDLVSSPTFAIVQEYFGPVVIAHADWYRIGHAQELFDIGFEELLDGSRVVFVEWGDRALEIVPDCYLQVSFRHRANIDERDITLVGQGPQWQDRIVGLQRSIRAAEKFLATDATL